ncbi:MAG: DUF1015 domain-containing protein [Methanomassiliicoccales archaeon]|nr:DUF1015 domain-containing protein [Methanomassiliicoccales archaeon]
MVKFRPFNGFLPSLAGDETILDRISPPYDVIGKSELTKLQNKPYNVARITLGGVGGSYEKASKELQDWIARRALVRDRNESYYLYLQTFRMGRRRYTRTGLIGLLGLEDYERGGIIPHEETMPKVKEDRLDLLRATSTHTESILGLSQDLGDLTPEVLHRSSQQLFECEDPSGIVHSISRISDIDMKERISETMRNNKVLIADGHHRYETAMRYLREAPEERGRSWILATLACSKDPGVLVFPTHRVLKAPKVGEKDVTGAMKSRFKMTRLSTAKSLERSLKRTSKTSLGIIFRSGNVFKVELAKYESDDPMWEIDSYVFQEVMLNKILYSLARPEEVRIDYDHDFSSVERKMDRGAYDMAVLLRSPRLETIWKLAAAGRRMPKKTTYFWPKVWSGFVMHRIG